MTPQAWQTLGTIFGIVAAIVSISYLQRSSAREAQRMREAAVQRAVEDAKTPLLAQITALQRDADRKDGTITELNRRVDQLEDELRRGRGYGDSDRSRQPRP